LIKPSPDFAMTLVLLLTLAVGSFADANLRGDGLPPNASVEMPDASGPLDHAGPYAEEPNEAEATKPKAAKAKVEYLEDFCNLHETGFWCKGSTRLRCCKLQDGEYAKCGSAVNSTFCGWESPVDSQSNGTIISTFSSTLSKFSSTLSKWWGPGPGRRRPGGGYPGGGGGGGYPGGGGGGGWHIHPGWHVSSYCESHHVGQFCNQHRIVHCCSDYGHWVECDTQYHHNSWNC